MNILYLAFVRLPTEKAHGVQIMKTCEALAEAGTRVTLAIPGRKTAIQEDPFDYYGVQKNFTLLTLVSPDWVQWGSIGFAFSALWFSEKAKWQKSFWKADSIYSRDAFVLLQYVFLGRKLVYEAHTRPTFISTLVAKRAHKLVVISEGLRDAYLARGVLPEKIVVAHDAIDPEPFRVIYDQKEERARLGIPLDKKVALYVGKIDSAKGADTFAEASEHAPDDWCCVLIGSGPLKESLQKRYSKVLFLPETPYRDLPRTLSTADVLVLPNSAKDIDAAQYTSPLKAFAYMATEKPIVASRVPALTAILKSSATYFTPDDATSCAETITSPTTPVVQEVYTWCDRATLIYNALI